MAYQIDRYNRTLLTVVEDGTLDETTDLRFIGKNYAGYGEIHNENFLFLLENFANATPPPRAINGQIWFDTSQSKLKFYDGTIWRSTGGSEVAASQPVGLSVGDFWWDNANDQLYVFNGTSYVLIGPQDAGVGTTQLVSQTILDDTSNSRSIIVAFVNDNPIAVFSPTQFTILNDPQNTLDGFSFIRQGITLKDSSTGETSSAFRFWGTASNADRLGGSPASDFVKAGTPSFSQRIEAGLAGISIASDFQIYGDSSGSLPLRGIISNVSGPNNEIRFRVNDGANVNNHVLTINTDGIAPAEPTTDVDLGTTNKRFRNIYADSYSGGAATKADSLLISGSTYLSASVNAVANTIVARSSDNTIFAEEFNGTATSAKYADLAEKYTTDKEYPVGTIMAVGGDAETTAADRASVVVGVISEAPAYLMNSECDGQAIGLKGRVPVRIVGGVKKGDPIYVDGNGVGTATLAPTLVGVALEDNDSLDEKLVECVLKV